MALNFSGNRFQQYEAMANGYKLAMKKAKTPQEFESNKKELLEVRRRHYEIMKEYYKRVFNDPKEAGSLNYKQAKEFLTTVSLDYFTRFDRQLRYGQVR